MRVAIVLMALVPGLAGAGEVLERVVGSGYTVDESVPKPAEILGFQPGERHIRHGELARYMHALAEASPRVTIQRTGRSHEGRPVLLLHFSSPDNIDRLDSLREQHLAGDGPLVVWLGYSIHGDEASGSNAAPLVAWYLAASQEQWLNDLLADTVIMLDPSLNPDGMARFAQWTNGNAGENPSADSNDREHAQGWPSGRTNHYWFDLNRDWLPVVHPVSRARVTTFQRWRPHVFTDHHEMGGESTFFFQPGVPSRTNPLTPEINQALTAALAEYHGEALSERQRLFFTREVFDDFYYGKGSTYPDMQGSIGILFEQGSSRGQRLKSRFGTRDLADGMTNQLAVSLSTLRGADAERERIFEFRADADRQAVSQADSGAWVFGDDGDPARAGRFIDTLLTHGIEVHALNATLELDGETFEPGSAWAVPRKQRRSQLVRAIFEQRTEFPDETFYDVSAWTLPLAYDLPFASTSRMPEVAADPLASVPGFEGGAQGDVESPVALVMPWSQWRAPAALYQMLESDYRVQALEEPVTVSVDGAERQLAAGAIVIPTGYQDSAPDEVVRELESIAVEHGVEMLRVASAATPAGTDLGSPSAPSVDPIKPLLVTGPGVSAYEAGEAWYFLDQHVGFTPTRVDTHRLARVDLEDYTHLLMVNGRYDDLGEDLRDKVRAWVKRGGQLVATKSAANWAGELLAANEEGNDTGGNGGDGEKAEEEKPGRRDYGSFDDDQAEHLIGGAIVELDMDPTHPLGFGLDDRSLPVLKNSTVMLEPADNRYVTAAAYAEKPLLAGFVSGDNRDKLADEPAIVAQRLGQGSVIRFADNPLFRGHWWGSARVYMNALFFAPLIEDTELRRMEEPASQ